MLKVKFDDKQLKAFANAVLTEVTDFIFAESQKNIVKQNIIDETTLLKTANVNRDYDSIHQQITYPVPYAETIEYGRLPGSMPPVEAIKGWVYRKIGVK